MKVIILAAGIGSRLGVEDIPKALTRLVNGKSILEFQLDSLAHYLSLGDVSIVVGFHEDKIMTRFPNLVYVHNPHFTSENTAKSLLRGLANIENEDVLWLNGDVVFRHEILEPLLTDRKNAMIVNTAVVGEEEVKYQVDDLGHILEVSKQVSDPAGEALGINFFSAKDLHLLKEALGECGNTDYFERAVQSSIDAGVEVWASPISPELCVEVDFPEDLERANSIIKSWPT